MADRAERGTEPRATTQNHHQVLPAGQSLGAYRIESTLGVGTFGVTYLAVDPKANRRVAIKEYLPSDIVVRDKAALRGSTAEEADLLRRGRERFLSEGRRLQRVKHPSIVRVLDAFEANNTGYLVFEHESGESLADALAGTHTLSDEPILRRFALALLEAIDAVHAAAFLHGKIEPTNIRLRPDGTPVLLDFGTARAASGLARHATRIPLTPGYAAIEQYTSQEAQGPWTDLYGLAAVLYRVITGRDPLDAPARLLEDRLLPASDAGSGRFSRALLKAVDAALAVRPEDRPQTVAEWRPMLDRPLTPQAAAARDPATLADEDDDYVPPLTMADEQPRTGLYITVGVVGALVLGTATLAGIGYLSDQTDVRRNAAGGVLATQNAGRLAESRGNTSVLPLPAPADDDFAREARQREQERQRVAAEAAAAARAAEEQRVREARQREQQSRQEQERQQQLAARQAEEQKRREAQQEQTRQALLRQEQARQEQERQAAARAAEEVRQREAASRQEAARQEQTRQEAVRQEQARQEAARQEAARQETARQEAARQEQARQEAVRQDAARQEQARQEAVRQETARQQERQATTTRLAEELRQRDAARQQQEQITAARTMEEARAREQARAPAEAERTATTGSAMLLPPPVAQAAPAAPPAAAAAPATPATPVSPAAPAEAARSVAAPVPLTGPVVLTPPQQPPPQQIARAPAPTLTPPAARPEPVVAAVSAARAAIDVGRIDAVNWQWGYVVMHMEQRQGMQVGDRVFARSGDAKLWMTVRRVSGTQVSAVPDSDLQRYSVSGRVYKE